MERNQRKKFSLFSLKENLCVSFKSILNYFNAKGKKIIFNLRIVNIAVKEKRRKTGRAILGPLWLNYYRFVLLFCLFYFSLSTSQLPNYFYLSQDQSKFSFVNPKADSNLGQSSTLNNFFFHCQPTFLTGSALWAEAVQRKADSLKEKKEPERETGGSSSDKENSTGSQLEKGENRALDFQYKMPKEESMPDATWLLVKTIAILSLFVAGLVFILRFLIQKNKYTIIGQELVNVVSSIPLAQGKMLQVVDIAGKIFILGMTDNSISLITEITEPAICNRIKLEGSKIIQKTKNTGFLEIIRTMAGKSNLLGKNNSPGVSFFSGLKDFLLKGKRSKKVQLEDREEFYSASKNLGKDFLDKHRSRLDGLKTNLDSKSRQG
jgi:flagellar protein FliO/FliZ